MRVWQQIVTWIDVRRGRRSWGQIAKARRDYLDALMAARRDSN